jgi:very-short-patch-repair endonuclease
MSAKGTKLSAEARARLSAACKGRKHSPETKAKMSLARKGIRPSPQAVMAAHSPKANAKRRDSLVKVWTKEKRMVVSKISKERHQNPKFKRKHHRGMSVAMQKWWDGRTEEQRVSQTRASLKVISSNSVSEIERMVVKELSKYKLKFVQQAEFKRYHVDVYLPKHKLVIECDGSWWHKDSAAHDKKRDRYLHKLGLTVVRLKEKHIRKDVGKTVFNMLLKFGLV